MAGKHYDLCFRIFVFNFSKKLDTVNAGHFNIGNDHRDVGIFEDVQGIRPVFGGKNFVADIR